MYKINFGDNTVLEIISYYQNGQNNEMVAFTIKGTYEQMLELFSDSVKTENIKVYYNDSFIAEYTRLSTIVSWNINPMEGIVTVTLKEAGIEETVIALQNQVNELNSQINSVVDLDKMTLDEYKNYRQEENKAALAEFLSNSVVTYNGENYGVMEEDQNEMALQLLSYQTIKSAREAELDAIQAKIDAGELSGSAEDYVTISEPVLEWHSKKKSCKTFTEQEFLELTYLVKSFVYPYMQKMQKIKEDIFLCETKEAVAAIRIEYA